MTYETFDRLLESLPKIAEAVNKFESSEVQEQAFEALARALGTRRTHCRRFPNA